MAFAIIRHSEQCKPGTPSPPSSAPGNEAIHILHANLGIFNPRLAHSCMRAMVVETRHIDHKLAVNIGPIFAGWTLHYRVSWHKILSGC